MSQESTTITKSEVTPQELNELFGAGDILLQEEKKPGFFTKPGPDMTFLKPEVKEETRAENKEDKKEEEKKEEPKVDIQDIVNELEPTEAQPEETRGRSKVSKDALIESTRKLIEKGVLIPFEDDKKIEDYTASDFEELYEANLKNKEEEIRTKTPIEFFDSLPEQLQYAAKYVADGGQDLKGLFRVLAQVEETSNLSEEVPEDQETICREYLSVTNFGTAEDITEEINSWKDLNKLAEKAEKFKPRLEKLRSEQIAQKLSQAEQSRKQREQAAAKYQSSVYDTLKAGKLGNLGGNL